MVARDAAWLVKEKQLQALVFEGDALLVLPLSQWKIGFSRRETNKVAHRLARMSLSTDNPILWFEELHDVIVDLLFEDSNS
ncbi:hypothetical protein D8674_034847 [Pyrus ussuriensis x Pyrus communis]|uniref:RNase H type-1 domain-containing protein n=1 Tax=Pyrus ussuriensis x Pyrus communis TaxID=2448454 RepID=A0A5N5GFG5_9ROSA|nr:hypothetical protein D8674_034847 [Pyrus ussuriensis x Pyrus communis]